MWSHAQTGSFLSLLGLVLLFSISSAGPRLGSGSFPSCTSVSDPQVFSFCIYSFMRRIRERQNCTKKKEKDKKMRVVLFFVVMVFFCVDLMWFYVDL